MIRRLLWMLLAIIVLLFVYAGYTISTTRSHSPEATVALTVGSTKVNVEYCRPYKKGREIFGELVPFGEYWRTGANEPTRIEFTGDIIFGNQRVSAGKYRLYTIPNKETWKVVLNSELEEWGYYEPDYDLDIANVVVPVSKTSETLEQFTINLREQEGNIVLQFAWDDTRVDVPIKV